MPIRRRIEKFQEFPAFDQTGRRYTVREFVESHEVASPDGPAMRWQPVRWSYSTDKAQLVDKLEDGSLRVIRTGVRLHRA